MLKEEQRCDESPYRSRAFRHRASCAMQRTGALPIDELAEVPPLGTLSGKDADWHVGKDAGERVSHET